VVTPRKPAAAGKQPWVPERRDIIWINCNPQAGNEMRDLHPFLVLSPRAFNERTSLVIGLPMTTAEYNADNPFAVAVGNTHSKKSASAKTSYVLCHQPKSFDWRSRKASPHPLKRLGDSLFAECCARLNQIVQIAL
jgi:mRNA interferase MazF